VTKKGRKQRKKVEKREKRKKVIKNMEKRRKQRTTPPGIGPVNPCKFCVLPHDPLAPKQGVLVQGQKWLVPPTPNFRC
jgi:hypothetical protein